MRSTSLAALAAVCLAATACLPRERLNASCRWTGDAAAPPSGERARRAHLIEDVQVAQELGIRHADSTMHRLNTPGWRAAQARCTDAMLGEIARRHSVSPANVAALRGARVLWIDLVAIVLPVAVAFLAVTAVATRRLAARHAPGERGPAVIVLAVWTPVAAAVALGLTQCWGASVEEWRSHSDHVSYRAVQLPASRHPWLIAVGAAALFAAVAAASLLRTPPAARSVGRRRREGGAA